MSGSGMTRRGIKITWIKNPSQFAFIFLDCKDNGSLRLEMGVNRDLPTNQTGRRYTPQLNEVCRFLHKSTWFRVKIILIDDSTFFCWAMDYGFPFSTDKTELFAPLEENFQGDSCVIQFGRLNLLSAKAGFDFETCAKTEWSDEAITIMKNFAEYATKAEFLSEHLNGSWCGDIEFTDANNRKFSLCSKLIEKKLALKPDDKTKITFKTLYSGIVKSDCCENPNFELPDIIEPPCKDVALSKTTLPSEIETISRSSEICSEQDCSSCEQTPKMKNNFRSIYNSLREDVSVATKSSSPNASSQNEGFFEIIAEQKHLFSSEDVYRIFVHGKFLRKPLEYITDAKFSDDVHENLLKLKFKTIFRTQSHSWPNILDGRSMIIVNGPNSGKTFSYLPAIISLISNDKESSQTTALGPTGVIIARSSREVEKIYKFCVRLLPRQKMQVVKAYGKWNCENKIVELLNGCDLLISTPPCFARLTAVNVIRVIDKDHLKFLIFDDVDVMSSIYEEELESVIRTCTSGEKGSYKNPQIVVTSSIWMDQLQSRYAKLACDPIFIIGSFIESAVYANCRFSLSKETLDGKLLRLLSILEDGQWKQKRTVIVTNSLRDFNKVDSYLKMNFIECCKINHLTANAYEIAKNWSCGEPGDMAILLVTDEALVSGPKNRISSAEVLINFSLPEDWTKFSRRFFTLKDCFLGVVEEKISDRPSTIVMLDDANSKEAPTLIEFLQTRGVVEEFPEEINKMVKQIVAAREMVKENPHYENVAQVCSKVLQFGSCENRFNCKRRHVFTEADRPVNLPDGFVKFAITAIRNPSHFSVKILEYWPLEERKWVSCEAKLNKIEESLLLMQKSLNESAVMHIPVKVDDICAVYRTSELKWCRCRVLQKQQTSNGIFEVAVQLIDQGQKLLVKSNELMKLSRQLISMDPLICSLRILNIIPYDKDQNWDHETTSELRKRLKVQLTSSSFCIARVSFAIKGVIFAENIEVQNRIVGVEAVASRYTLKRDLIKSEFCLRDDSVAEKLKQLLQAANLNVSRAIEASPTEMKTNPQAVQPKWKQLAVGGSYNVRLTHFQSPDLFYVLVKGSANSTIRLHMKTIENFDDLKPLSDVNEGTFCLVAELNEKRQRGRILKKIGKNFVRVVLLDAGKIIECDSILIHELPQALVDIAPFQAVQCRLMGVKPKFEIKTWEKAWRLSSAFAEFIHERCDGEIAEMQIVARKSHIFDVLLFDPTSKRRLDEMAVEERYAATDETFTYQYKEAIELEYENAAIEEPADRKSSVDSERLVEMFTSPDYDLCLGQDADAVAGRKYREENKRNFLKDEKAAKKQEKMSKQMELEESSKMSFIYRHPKIEFRQNDQIIILDIKATDAVDYALEISDESMKIQVIYKSYKERTEVFFYRLIDSAYASHEMVAGVRIIVRLVKQVFGVFWPRLTESDEPNRFITNLAQESLPFNVTESAENIHGKPCCYDDDESFDSDILNEDENVPI